MLFHLKEQEALDASQANTKQASSDSSCAFSFQSL